MENNNISFSICVSYLERDYSHDIADDNSREALFQVAGIANDMEQRQDQESVVFQAAF